MDKVRKASSSKSRVVQGANDKGKGKLESKSIRVSKTSKKAIQAPLRIEDDAHNERAPQVESDSESGEEEEASRGKRKVKIPVSAYEAALNACAEIQVRWGDVDLLRKLGLLFDVRVLLRNIGMESVLDMDHGLYHPKAAEVIASASLKLNKRASRTIHNLGYLDFFMNGEWRELPLEHVCRAYGFKFTTGCSLENDREQDKKVWNLIGSGRYTPGATRSALIKNPVIRYVHKLIANTLFARKEADKIKEGEMALLVNGLKPLFEEEFARQGIKGYEDINLGVILVKRMISTKLWAFKGRSNPVALHFGGFLTPLLLATKLDLGEPSTSSKLKLDASYLIRGGFLSGGSDGQIGYNFTSSNGEECLVLLPNTSITRLNSEDLDNLCFVRGEEAMIKENEALEKFGKKKKQCDRSGPSNIIQELPLGSPRYYHSSFKGKATSKAVEYALEGVAKNQKWNKWNSRGLHKLRQGYKKKIKSLEDQILGLKAMFETYVLRKQTPPSHQEDHDVFEVAMEEARRHSISCQPTSSTHHQEAPRSSSYEQGARRKRRHIPTPSPPSSENPSLHLSDSDSEG